MRFLFTFLFILFLIHSSYSQDKGDNPLLDDRFLIELGAFVPSQNVGLRADAETPNEEVNWMQTFNLRDNEVTFFFHFEWRFSKNRKWKLAAEYFGVNNGNSVTLSKDFSFQDLTFKAGSTVRAGLEFNLIRAFVGRTIIAREKHLLGAGLGVHAIKVGAIVEGEILTNEGDKTIERRPVSAILPLPNIGAWYYWAPHSKWYFGARVDWFGLTIDQYSGSLWNLAPQVKFQILRNFGMGLDYRFLFVEAKVNESKWKGGFKMDFTGPLLTLHANF